MRIILYLLIIIALLQIPSIAQEKNNNKGIFVEKKGGFFEEILDGIEDFENKETEKEKVFKLDFTGIDLPKSPDEFKSAWFNEPVSQGNTGTCWSFSTTSFFESEVYRLHKKEVKLSEIYTAYWEYVEKTKRFVRERGNSVFGEGSEANAVTRIWKEYGVVPAEVYNGMKEGQKFHNHTKMFDEMKSYLNNLKVTYAWDEEEAVKTIKAIMNHHIGQPPAEFEVDGKKYTPQSYLKNYLQLNPDDYADVLSLKQEPYWKQVVYHVPDNWWFSADYYNLPLDDFMNAIKNAVKNGYTLAIGGDVSEAGYYGDYNAAIVPTFDIPSEYINEDSRQFRFSNGTTEDDHGLHLVGYTEKNGVDWFLIKDSGASSRNGNAKGYYFYHEDYLKLKIMDFMVHKDAIKDVLEKFEKN